MSDDLIPDNFLTLNPEAIFSTMDCHENNLFVCQIYKNGNLIKQYSIPSKIKDVLHDFDGKTHTDTILDFHQCNINTKKLVSEFLIPNGILLDSSNEFDDQRKSPDYVKFKLQLLDKDAVNSFSELFSFLFRKNIFILAAIATAVPFLLVILFHFIADSQLIIPPENSVSIIHTVAFIGIALIFHELGHAAAARFFGCKNVTIGVAVYICFLVFYADLSESWRLTGRQRLLVDISGSIFQGIIALVYLLLYFILDYSPLLNAFILLNIYTLYNLNPFFRMDGYWIASDILKISNLRDKSKEIIYKFVRYPTAVLSELKDKKRRTLIYYSFFSAIIHIVFIFIIATSITPQALESFNESTLNEAVNAKTISDFIVVITKFFWGIMFLAFSFYFYVTTAKSVYGICRHLILKK